jgi:DNA-binding MarR family transcriptional regulator
MSEERDHALGRIDASMQRITRIGRSHRASRVRTTLSGVDLNTADLGMLGALHREGPLRAAALAEAAAIEPAVVSRELKSLQGLGLVTVETDPTDGRARIITITEPGRATYLRFRLAIDEAIASALGSWTDGDLATLAHLLERAVDDLTAPRVAGARPAAGSPARTGRHAAVDHHVGSGDPPGEG